MSFTLTKSNEEKEMRKLIIVSHMFPNNIDINSGIFVYEQVKSIAKLCKYKVTVLSPVPCSPRILWFRKKWRDYGRVQKNRKIGGIQVLYIRYLCFPGSNIFFLQGVTMFFSILLQLRKLISKKEEVIVHVYSALPDGLAVSLLKLFYRNIKTVLSVLGSDINTYPYRNRITMLFTKYSLSHNNAVAAVSNDLAHKCRRLCRNLTDRMEVIYNGLDEDWFKTSEKEQIEIERMEKEYKYNKKLLFAGEIIKEKGIYELIYSFAEIAKKYNDICLFIVGDGTEREELQRALSFMQISHRVIFTGRVSHKQVKLYMKLSDMLILPSYSEGMPNVVIEAMGLGRPVIAADVGGVKEVVKDRHNGILIKPGSVKEIYDAVELLLKDGALSRLIAYNANKTIRKGFSWTENASRLDSIYENLLRR